MDSSALLVNVIGFVATIVGIVLWIPQARTTWQNRNDAVKLAGVSETTQWLSLTNYLLWGVFGALTDSFWVAAPGLIGGPLAIATIVVVRRARRLAPMTRSVPIVPTHAPGTEAAVVAELAVAESVPVISLEPVPVVATGSVPIIATATATASEPDPVRAGHSPATGGNVTPSSPRAVTV